MGDYPKLNLLNTIKCLVIILAPFKTIQRICIINCGIKYSTGKGYNGSSGKVHKTVNHGSSGKEAHKMGKRTKQQTMAVVGKKRTKWESAQNSKPWQ